MSLNNRFRWLVLLFAVTWMAVLNSRGFAQIPDSNADSDHPAALVGTWKVDLEKTKKLYPDGEVAELEEMAKVQIQFKADGTVLFSFAGDQVKGSWKTAERENEKGMFDMEVRPEGIPNEEEPLRCTVAVMDGNTIRFKPENETEAVLVRVAQVDTEKARKLFLGSWQGSVEKTLEHAGDISDEMKERITNQIGAMTLEFREDGSYTLQISGSDDIEGTWKVQPGDDEKTVQMIVETGAESGGEKLTFDIQFLSDDHVSMSSDPDQPAAHFIRMQR